MISRRFKVAVVAGAVVGAAGVGGFGRAVRYEAGVVAERYGAAVAIERVTPSWGGVKLRGVDVSVALVPSAKIHLDEVEVSYGRGGRTVSLRGGQVSAIGGREEIVRQVEAWRARHSPSESGGGSRSGGGTELDGLGVSWKNDATAPTEAVAASDVRFARGDGKISVSAGKASVTLGRTGIEIKNGKVELTRRAAGGYGVAALSADGVEGLFSLPAGKAEAAQAREDGGGKSGALRKALIGAVRALDATLEPSATVRLGGVQALVRRGEESLNLGPGELRVTRADGRMIVDLAPELRAPKHDASRGGAPEEALTFRLSVPLGEAPAPQEIVVDVQGGPIWLSSLGVKEGDFGLFDVSQASITTRSHLVLSADGKGVTVDGEGRAHALSLRSAALSDEPVAGIELAFRLKGDVALDGSRVRIEAGEVDLGAIHLAVKGDYERVREAHRVRGTFDVPLTACHAMLESTPKGLVQKLNGMRLAGSFAIRGKVDVDTAHLDRTFRLEWDTSNTCRVVEAPAEVNVERFRKAFRRTAYDPSGRPIEIETGPGTASWVPLGSISKFMEAAVLTTEDGAFHRHHGFDQEAIRNSIRENLRKKKFVRGASTISMQLAKNLYLDRGKNVSRKLQEAVLTMYLEQELTKEQLLELYLNVVELGPSLYGIGPAARHYFNANAAELSLAQALYISSILPNPKVQHFGAGGAVAPGWMAYLRKLMKIARDRSRITDEELDEGLRETVVRGSPSPQRSARPFTGDTGDAEMPDLQGDGQDWLGP